ncbi:MAG: hypothetical protein IRZ15_04945 [Bryobacteraceae bacterium]|nr:hypothetical protein [Bryobacteraceae bacterium]
MKHLLVTRHATAGLFALICALPAVADTRFTVSRMTRNDVPFGKGQCDIRLRVDHEVEVSVQGSHVFVRTIAGRDAQDAGSECNEPLPRGDVQNFRFEKHDGRGDMKLLAEPSRRNSYRAVVRIRDGSGGDDRYHFRLTWDITGNEGWGRPSRPRRDFRSGDAPEATIRYRGSGSGTYARSGKRSEAIDDAEIVIDSDGTVTASFETDRRRRISFTGRVTDRRNSIIQADVVSSNTVRDMRGEMTIQLDRRREIDQVSLNGQARGENVTLNWSR